MSNLELQVDPHVQIKMPCHALQESIRESNHGGL